MNIALAPLYEVINYMTIDIFIDNNAWDLFFDAKLDLSKELPSAEFSLYMTREAEFEIPKMPAEKRKYVESFINAGGIKTESYFGFYDDTLSPEEQRIGGFGDSNNPDVGGRFISQPETDFMSSESSTVGPQKRPTGLFKNEADVSLAARALHTAVLTCDGKKSLKRVKNNHGGLIIDLKKYQIGTSLAAFIEKEVLILKEEKG